MNSKFVVFGGTGELGSRIVEQLASNGNLRITAIVKEGQLKQNLQNVETISLDLKSAGDELLNDIFKDAKCVISALDESELLIVDGQRRILEFCRKFSIPKFIPSHFTIKPDFCQVWHPTLGMKFRFYEHVYKPFLNMNSGTRVQFICCGAFYDYIINDKSKIFDFNGQKIHCWGSGNEEFSTIHVDDLAKFTAEIALNQDISDSLICLPGDRISINKLVNMMSELTGKQFQKLCLGSKEELESRLSKAIDDDNTAELDRLGFWQTILNGWCLMDSGSNNQQLQSKLPSSSKSLGIKDYLQQGKGSIYDS